MLSNAHKNQDANAPDESKTVEYIQVLLNAKLTLFESLGSQFADNYEKASEKARQTVDE